MTYTVSFTPAEGEKLVIPQKTESIGTWEVKNLAVSDPEGPAKLVYTLTTFTTGLVEIPETFFFYQKGAERKQLKTSKIPITVESVLAKLGTSADIRDIKPPMKVPVPASEYALWLLILAAIAAGAYAWYAHYRKRLEKNLPAAAETPVPPYQKALQELDKLRDSGLIREGRIKEFYISLYDIIRDYIAAVYSIETRDRTTSEIIADLRPKETDRKLVSEIKDFFDDCDLVKFAKYRPDETACSDDWERAKKLVEL